MTFSSLIRRPSAFLPLALAMAALAVVVVNVSLFGASREADEGTAAHLCQLLMASQILTTGFFALRWVPEAPRPGAQILALHLCGALSALAPVWFLGL